DNVNRLVDTLYREIKKTKPWVKFGVSPFGIWRPGYPASVRGFDAYDKLYADSRRWINEGHVDYLTPQLYWKLSAPLQGYGQLLAWWRGENTLARHIWAGNYANRVGGEGGTAWPASEIVEQVRVTRESATSPGNVHFSMKVFLKDSDRLVERLAEGPYAHPALVPATPWLSSDLPLPPTITWSTNQNGVSLNIVSVDSPTDEEVAPRSRRPSAAALPPTARSPRWWTIRLYLEGSWRVAIIDARLHDIALPSATDGALPTHILVTAVDRVGNESQAVAVTPTP
ncbi:MAG: family 10 glycosylhydrolase, partial [Gemmatimonadaceae bacterium]